MKLESMPLPKDDSTQTKAPLKHVPVKKNAIRRVSTNKLATVTTNDSMHLTGDTRLNKERELNEAQKNGKSDNTAVKTIEKAAPTANINKEERKGRTVNSSVTQQDQVKDIQINAGEKSIKSNVVKVVEYAPTRSAEIDETTTEEDIANCVGHKANANDISIVVCTWNGCNKYFTKMEKFTQHRKRDHDTTEVAKDIWIFGNVNRGGDTSTSTVPSKSAEIESLISTQKTASSPIKVAASLPVNPSSPIVKIDGPSTSTPTTAATVGPFGKPRRSTKDQSDVSNLVDSSIPSKRSRDPTVVEKEVIGKRRETQVSSPQFPSGHNNNGNNNNNEIRQVQRPLRRFVMEEEPIIAPDARMRYPRGNRGQNANPMYGLPYDTGDPRYYNTMQMHPLGFVYGEMPPPPPPRYDTSYGDIPYGQFYGNNRRFLNSPPPPPPPPPSRRSR